MFKVNDYVVYGLSGVCQITDIEKETHRKHDETAYYVLRPVYNNTNNLIIKLPMNNPNLSMRPILTKDEVLSLIAAMPKMQTIWIDDNRDRNVFFNAILKRGNCEEKVKLIKTLYLERESRSVEGKTLTHTDEELMKTAEKQLNEEFALALNISPDEVLPYIFDHVS